MLPMLKMRSRAQAIAIATVSIALICSLPVSAQKASRKPPAKTTARAVEVDDGLASALRAAMSKALEGAEKTGDCAAAQTALDTVFDQAIFYGDPADQELFRDVSLAKRLVQQVNDSKATDRAELIGYLLKNTELARALAFVIQPKVDRPVEVFRVLHQLRTRHGNRLNAYANLTAAICVVHDTPLSRSINENTAFAPPPLDLFEYFVANDKRMFFGIREIPAELLVYVVDSTAGIDEMSWALQRYAGDKNVGARFFDIKYDYDHFHDGDTKKVTNAGWSLPNILKYGGVCADQAYFAVSVGKAIGVPTAYTRGVSGEVSHAWAGFLQTDGRRAWWNFDSGRYEVYQGVRGSVRDPQTGAFIPDSYVSLLADFVSAKTLDRQAAIALTDAARRLLELQKKGGRFEPPPPPEKELVVRRSPKSADALALLESALRSSPGCAAGWETVRQMASDGLLSLDDKKKWEGVLYRLCGERYPDFYLTILGPMIQSVENVQDQNALWNAAFANFPNRSDLAASVRIQQAAMWLKNNEPEKAGQCYENVINRYANAGPFVIEALLKAEKILREVGDGRRILMLYEQGWSHIKKPREMAEQFFKQSNFYRVGSMYAARLDEAGLGNEAAKVRRAIGAK